MVQIFIEGGVFWMALLTLELIGVLLAAWKAPGWVKEAGLIAVMTGLLGTLIGISQLSGVVHQLGDIAPGIIFGGLKVALITFIYGSIIYCVSLIIRIIQKPRFM